MYYYHPDHLGSSSYITDREGQIIQHTEYIAFGETFVDEHSTSNKQPYLFNGKELDFETGLYYYGARYYDPKTSIFLNVDPLVKEERYFDDEDLISNGGGIFNPMNYGVYSYTYNNPIMLTDPDGKCPICLVLVFAGYAVLDAPTQNRQADQKAKQEATNMRNRVLVSTMTGGVGGAASQVVDELGTSSDFIRPGKYTSYKEQNSTQVQTNSNNKYISGWKSSSLKNNIKKFAPNSKPELNSKGSKDIYTNSKTGTKVIYDKKGNYFRIQDKEGHYLDLNGKRVNAPSGLSGKEASDYVKKNTHFKNSD